jgi:hypothetical protein
MDIGRTLSAAFAAPARLRRAVAMFMVGPRGVCRGRRGLLPSAGITRPQRYYEPIRHLRSPALALAGSPLARSCRFLPRPQTSLVAHCSCPVRAAITTLVGSPLAGRDGFERWLRPVRGPKWLAPSSTPSLLSS